jgi:RNA polymerase-binding transcription factor DksA
LFGEIELASQRRGARVILLKIKLTKGEFMPENKPTRENLERRRDEIHAQLNRVNEDLQIELDRDPEEQAIQLEQDEVSIARENNLRKELAIIEDQLLDFEDE